MVLEPCWRTPLLREGSPYWRDPIRRTEVRPFTEKHINLLETFAAQAVIAIENVRLFKEIQERNAESHRSSGASDGHSEVLSSHQSLCRLDVQTGTRNACRECAARLCGA